MPLDWVELGETTTVTEVYGFVVCDVSGYNSPFPNGLSRIFAISAIAPIVSFDFLGS